MQRQHRRQDEDSSPEWKPPGNRNKNMAFKKKKKRATKEKSRSPT